MAHTPRRNWWRRFLDTLLGRKPQAKRLHDTLAEVDTGRRTMVYNAHHEPPKPRKHA